MLFATAFASCTDEDFLAGELQGTQLADSREVKIAVTETDWQGQTVSLTRAGETLEQLKASSERTWDFTSTSRTDLNLLKADAAKTDGKKWSYNEGDNRYTNTETINGALEANGIELYMTEGLSISSTSDNTGEISIYVDKQLQLEGSNIKLTISNLKAGQEVTITFAATGEAATFDTRTNLKDDATGFAAADNNTTQVGKATVQADGDVTFMNTKDETGINIYSITVSRAESDGFGLYSDSERMQVINSHIVWDADIHSWKGISNDAYLMLWPNNIVKCDVAFNGTDKQSKPGYYTITENHNFDTKFNGCTYGGITFNKGLKMEDGTTISFNVGALASSDNSATVTIVQSDWQDNGNPHGTPNTIMFDINGDGDYDDDGEALDVASAVSIPGGKVYTIKKVAYGNHTITCGSGESGLFYVSVDIPFTAYAPYIDKGRFATADTYSDDPSDYGIVSRNKDAVVFKPYKDNRIDLMYAEHTTSADGVVQLNFKHALGKLSIGTIYNNYGENIKLTQIKLSSKHFCQKGTLNLNTGEWTENKVNTSYEETYGSEALAVLFGNLKITDKGKLTFPKDVAYTQIPGTTLSFEYTFETDNNTEFTVTKDLTIQQGKNIYININIGQNHEVVLQ